MRYDSGYSNNQNQAIFGYNPSNDTFYSIASLPNTQNQVFSAVMIGRNVYMGTLQSDMTIFNYDNQTIWELTNIGSPSCNSPSYGDFGYCGRQNLLKM